MMIISQCLCSFVGYREKYRIDGRRIGECTRCGLIRTVDVPLRYEQLYTVGSRYHGPKKYLERYDHDLEIAKIRFQAHQKYFQAPVRRLLDVGCANGAFLRYALALGISSEGIEPNAKMAEIIRSQGLEKIYQQWPQNGRSDHLYDLVTYHDVLEHIRYPLLDLSEAYRNMHVDSLLVVDTPDGGDLDGDAAHHLKPVEHLWFFKEQDLVRILTIANFDVIGIEKPIPGKIVAYAKPHYEGP